MLNFISGAFRFFVELDLWGTLIVCFLGGGVGGAFIDFIGGGRNTVFFVIGGIIIGIIVGIFLNIIRGGLISIFLQIDNNLQTLIKANGGEPIDYGIDFTQEKTQAEEINDTKKAFVIILLVVAFMVIAALVSTRL
jgi:hypothetical protein